MSMPESELRAARAQLLLDDYQIAGVGSTQARRWQMLLLPLCIAEADRHGADPEKYVRVMSELVQNLHDALVPSWYKQTLHGDLAVPYGDPDVTMWMWRHRHVQSALESGLTSPEFTRLDSNELRGVADFYLNLPWLRHPKLDWLFVDALMANETLCLGEEAKKALWVRFSIFAPWSLRVYADTKGDLGKMAWKQTLAGLQSKAIKFALFVLFPLGLGYMMATTANDSLRTGLAWGLGIYMILFLINLVWTCIARAIHFWKTRGQERNPKIRFLKLHAKMADAYNLLSGKAISTRQLRDALAETTSAGAAWPTPVMPLVDRALEKDGAVWAHMDLNLR
jgi:hypothetical protein